MAEEKKIEAVIMLTRKDGYWNVTYNGKLILVPRDMQRILRGLKLWYKTYLRGLNYGPNKILSASEKARKVKDAEDIKEKTTQHPEGTK